MRPLRQDGDRGRLGRTLSFSILAGLSKNAVLGTHSVDAQRGLQVNTPPFRDNACSLSPKPVFNGCGCQRGSTQMFGSTTQHMLIKIGIFVVFVVGLRCV